MASLFVLLIGKRYYLLKYDVHQRKRWQLVTNKGLYDVPFAVPDGREPIATQTLSPLNWHLLKYTRLEYAVPGEKTVRTSEHIKEIEPFYDLSTEEFLETA